MRTVRVVVAGDTLDFLFDTAAGFTTITPELAARIGCVPSGRVSGRRMTGQPIEAPVCHDVALGVGGERLRADAAVLDAQPYRGRERPVHGIISVHTLLGRPITLDMTRGELVLETAASAARRVRGLTPLRMRLATGESGGSATPFVAVRAGGTELWFEWDSNHTATTFVAPWAARALSLPDTSGGDVTLQFGRQLPVRAPVEVKPSLIHDGVLSAEFVARGVWTLDAAAERLWVTPLTPLLEPPPAVAEVHPPAADPTGWYDLTLTVDGRPQRAAVQVRRVGGELSAALRFAGSERVFALRDVRAAGGTLEFGLPMRATYPVRLRFDGVRGTGSWGDPAQRGGEAVARKRA
jgi:hypothetical protein